MTADNRPYVQPPMGGTVRPLTKAQLDAYCRGRLYVSLFMAVLVVATWLAIWLVFG